MPTPYSEDLAGREPLQSLAETPERIRRIVDGFNAAAFERSYAPGKWTAAQILLHLVHTELAFSNRVRLALSSPDYLATSFNQDDWLAREAGVDGRTAFSALYALRQVDLPLFRGLSSADRACTFRHLEWGTQTVWWLVELLAGHELHHLTQLEVIAGGAAIR